MTSITKKCPISPPRPPPNPPGPPAGTAAPSFAATTARKTRPTPAPIPAYARRLREAYAASVSYMDAQAGRVLCALDESGLADNTVVVIWSDNGFLLGKHAMGQALPLRACAALSLMIRHPGMPQPGVVSNALVETVDLLPTLADLCALPPPDGLDGRSLRPQLENPQAPTANPSLGFWNHGQRTVRTERWRLIVQTGKDGAPVRQELFDYQTDPGETRNHADAHPQVVAELLKANAPHACPTTRGIRISKSQVPLTHLVPISLETLSRAVTPSISSTASNLCRSLRRIKQ